MVAHSFWKLKGRIKEKGYTIQELSCLVSISYSRLSLKLNGTVDFKLKEINRICEILDIAPSEKWEYF